MILVINCGSSSLKYQLFAYQSTGGYKLICKGLAERIGIDGVFHFESNNTKETSNVSFPTHDEVVTLLAETLINKGLIKSWDDIQGIGHRIVNGGVNFTKSVVITKEVIDTIANNIALAPLHNPGALTGIKAFQKQAHIPAVAVFDTSFHHTLKPEKYLYAVPYEWYEKYQVKRYGAHGISYRYITKAIAHVLEKNATEINCIICHLGNGSSMCAVAKGKSINTSMGFTPLSGLIMGSRSGDVDPSMGQYLATKMELSLDSFINTLNSASGLYGITNKRDMRDVTDLAAQGHERSRLVLKMVAQRIAMYLITYVNDLQNKVDAIVFTAGIGENSAILRQLVIDEINVLSLSLDKTMNEASYEDYACISDDQSTIPIYKMRTNEELMICQDVVSLLNLMQ